MKNTIKIIFFLFNVVLVLQANAQQSMKNIATTEQKVSLNATEHKRLLKKMYYKNGALKVRKHTLGTTLDGSWTYFYENGQVHKEGTFSMGKAHGIWKTYTSTGILVKIEQYERGVEQGEWKGFYTDGTLAVQGTFIDGKREGKWNVYTAEGLLEKTVTFKQDKDIHINVADTHQIAVQHTKI